MEKAHRNKVQKRYKSELKDARLICLDIPDEFEFMDEALVRLLKARVTRFLPHNIRFPPKAATRNLCPTATDMR